MQVYALLDPKTKEVRYVGKSKNAAARFNSHLHYARRGHHHRVCRWIATLLSCGEKPALLILETSDSPEDLNEAEIHWIAYFKFLGANLTNMTRGGDNYLAGTKLSEEHKRRISESGKKRQGWSLSPEGRENIRRSNTLKKKGVTKGPLSAAHRSAISAGNKGKKRTPEQRARVSEAAKRRKRA